MRDKQQFSQLLMHLYMQTDFKIPPVSFQIGDRLFLSYVGQKIGLKRKKFITDFDGVLEAEGTKPLYKLFFERLHDKDINPLINPIDIDVYIKSIFDGEPVAKVFAKIRDYLKSKNLTREQYYIACGRAAAQWKPNKDAWKEIQKIQKMGYDVTIISGSVQEALVAAAKKIDVEDYDVIGTKFEFDDFGYLQEIQPMLGEAKLEQKRRIVGHDQHIAATDDMSTDYLVTYGAALSIIIADKNSTITENERQLYVYDKTIRKNFSSIGSYVKKFEYAFVRSFRTSEIIEKRIVEAVRLLKIAKTKRDFLYYLRMMRFELEDFDLFHGSEIITEYEMAEDMEKEKKLRDEILFTLQQLPEYVNTETFVEMLGMKNESN